MVRALSLHHPGRFPPATGQPLPINEPTLPINESTRFNIDSNLPRFSSPGSSAGCRVRPGDEAARLPPDPLALTPHESRPPSSAPQIVFSDVTGFVTAPFFRAKSAQNGQLRKVCFFVSDGKWGASASRFARSVSVENKLQTLTLLSIPFSARKSRQIPSRRACHRLSPLRHRSLLGRKSAQKRPSSRAPEDFVLCRVFRGTTACRGPRDATACRGPRCVTACRTCHRLCHRGLTRQPAERIRRLIRQSAEQSLSPFVTACHRLSPGRVFGWKKQPAEPPGFEAKSPTVRVTP